MTISSYNIKVKDQRLTLNPFDDQKPLLAADMKYSRGIKVANCVQKFFGMYTSVTIGDSPYRLNTASYNKFTQLGAKSSTPPSGTPNKTKSVWERYFPSFFSSSSAKDNGQTLINVTQLLLDQFKTRNNAIETAVDNVRTPAPTTPPPVETAASQTALGQQDDDSGVGGSVEDEPVTTTLATVPLPPSVELANPQSILASRLDLEDDSSAATVVVETVLVSIPTRNPIFEAAAPQPVLAAPHENDNKDNAENLKADSVDEENSKFVGGKTPDWFKNLNERPEQAADLSPPVEFPDSARKASRRSAPKVGSTSGILRTHDNSILQNMYNRDGSVVREETSGKEPAKAVSLRASVVKNLPKTALRAETAAKAAKAGWKSVYNGFTSLKEKTVEKYNQSKNNT